VILAYIQPPYPDSKAWTPRDCVGYMLERVRQLKEGTDLLVLPEYANCPGLDDLAELKRFIDTDGASFLSQLREEARRKRVHLFVNAVRTTRRGLRNTTLWFDRDGRPGARYDKTHLTGYERNELGLIPGNTVKHIVLEGVRVTFATCFELYFSEYFDALAALRPDLVIVPTYQRSEHSELLTLQARARALDCGAYLLRCAYAMGEGEGSGRGGMSMLVHPRGEVVGSAGQQPGLFYAEADLREKWLRPASHGHEAVPARAIIEAHRRPFLYRGEREQHP